MTTRTKACIVFELVSAFGGIGLTLGIPTENYAFSGAFGPLSKLIVIIIMVRGRHRGLPVAIDRASKSDMFYHIVNVSEYCFPQVLLPEDLVPAKRESDPSVRSPVQVNGPQSSGPLQDRILQSPDAEKGPPLPPRTSGQA